MQFFAISLASPFVNLIKQVSHSLGSVTLFSTIDGNPMDIHYFMAVFKTVIK